MTQMIPVLALAGSPGIPQMTCLIKSGFMHHMILLSTKMTALTENLLVNDCFGRKEKQEVLWSPLISR